jgi:hypothetical protein
MKLKIKYSQELSFALLLSTVLIIISCYPLFYSGSVIWWILYIALIILLLGAFYPTIFTYPLKLWIKLGYFLGIVVSPVIMAIIFFFIFTPMGMILKLFGVDLLLEKRKHDADSYWIKRAKPPESMDKQF